MALQALAVRQHAGDAAQLLGGDVVVVGDQPLPDDFARRASAVTRGGGDRELLAVLFEQPYCRIPTVVSRTGVSRPTATKRLEALVAAGMLGDIKVGRDRLFINSELLQVLTRSDWA